MIHYTQVPTPVYTSKGPIAVAHYTQVERAIVGFEGGSVSVLESYEPTVQEETLGFSEDQIESIKDSVQMFHTAEETRNEN